MKKVFQLASLSLALVYALVLSAPAALASDIRISEFLANPDVTNSSENVENSANYNLNLEKSFEWIELQNTSTEKLTLNNYSITYSYGSPVKTKTSPIPDGTEIPARGYYVICALKAFTPNCNLKWNLGIDLKNASDATIKLVFTPPAVDSETVSPVVVDSVNYTATTNGQSTTVGLNKDVLDPTTQKYDVSVKLPLIGSVKLSENHGTPGEGDLIDTTVDTPVPVTPDELKTNTASLAKIDWEDVIDPSAPVTYIYQVSYSEETITPGGSFETPIYTSDRLTTSEIATPNTPEGTYFWHVRALDNRGNTSDWTTPRQIDVENVAPVVTLNNIADDWNKQPTISGTVNDAEATIALTIDDQAPVVLVFTGEESNAELAEDTMNPGTYTWTYDVPEKLAVGDHLVTAMATDIYGNVSEQVQQDFEIIRLPIRNNPGAGAGEESDSNGSSNPVILLASAPATPAPNLPVTQRYFSNSTPETTTGLSSVNTGDGSTLAQSNSNEESAASTNGGFNWWWLLLIAIALAAGASYAVYKRRQLEA